MNNKYNLTPEQVARNKQLVIDLRNNPLKAINTMRDSYGGRCCLCVAYDTAQAMGANLPECGSMFPPDEIAGWYGWPCKDPLLDGNRASVHNDGQEDHCIHELTHAQIADLFEKEFLA